jgi:hypothetical protein
MYQRYQMSIFIKKKKRYIKLKPLISSLLWNFNDQYKLDIVDDLLIVRQ